MASSSTPTSITSSGYGTLTRAALIATNANKMMMATSIQKAASAAAATNAFGSSLTMNREDHERERLRWQQKLDETENRLAEAEIMNSEMNQLKAELNRRIVEMERNQKPLIEQNRRLSERNRLLQNEIKKGEQRLCHSQDDFLTLKDEYERLVKENQNLKEKRAFPEKLEELDRYRNQVLEYSKCITALRQSALEKDRRYEMLVQKFKRLRKCVLPRRNGDTEDDRQSSFGGSDGSAESSISLDTITENFSESLDKDIESNYQQLAREHDELQRALSALKINSVAYGDEQLLLRDQLLYAQTTITQQQRLIEQHTTQSSESVMDFLGTITRLQDQIIALQAKCERVERELSESKENNELLEFQLLENNENMKHELEESLARKEGVDKGIETEKWIFEENGELLNQIPSTLAFEQVCDLKRDLLHLKKLASLDQSQRETAHQAQIYIDSLENQIHEMSANNSAEMKEYEKKTIEQEQMIDALREQIQQHSYNIQNEKMQELGIEIETLRANVHELEVQRQQLQQTVAKNVDEMKVEREKWSKENAATNANIETLEAQLKQNEHERKSIVEKVNAIEMEKNEAVNGKLQAENENATLRKQFEQLNIEKTSLLKANNDAKTEQNVLNEHINDLSKELGKIRYCLQQKDEQIANETKQRNDLKRDLEKTLEDRFKEIEQLKATTIAQQEELEIAKDKLSQIRREKKIVEEENVKLAVDLNSITEENQKLKDDVRPPIKTLLERRFEESRYRLNCALQTVHEYEDEIMKLRKQLSELEEKLDERTKLENDLVEAREYSEQLEKQFTTQVHIIDALKEKMVQHKKFYDFLSSLSDECEQKNCEDIEQKLESLCQSEKGDGNHDAVLLLKRLLKAVHSRRSS